jgi:hypothetical protein
VLCIVLSVVCYFCDVCYSVVCVIVVPLPPAINPVAVINNIYIYIYIYIVTTLLYLCFGSSVTDNG